LEIQTVLEQTLPLHILFYANGYPKSNEHDHWICCAKTNQSTAVAGVGTAKRQWLNHHPQHKPKQTFRGGYPTQTFAPDPRPALDAAVWKPKQFSGMKKPATPERVTGSIF
jgi:hypothetical protein